MRTMAVVLGEKAHPQAEKRDEQADRCACGARSRLRSTPSRGRGEDRLAPQLVPTIATMAVPKPKASGSRIIEPRAHRA